MEKNELLAAVPLRHSVRSYDGNALSAEHRAALEARIAEINEAVGLHIQLVPENGTYNSLPCKACGLRGISDVIALVGPDTPDLDRTCGYWGEELVLLAQALGLNTCWTGIYRRKHVAAAVAPGEKVSIIIAVGYGTHAGKPHKGKSFNDVANVSAVLAAGAGEAAVPQWFVDGVECALLAPTAMNQQKFTFTLAADGQVRAEAPKGSYTQTDLGIVEYHFELASGHAVCQ